MQEQKFQFTPLREGRLRWRSPEYRCGKFQFTPLREGRLFTPFLIIFIYISFNSRPCVRGDPAPHFAVEPRSSFNSRPCVRGDRQYKKYKLAAGKFQFTPLREGRPEARRAVINKFIVSIHAPA